MDKASADAHMSKLDVSAEVAIEIGAELQLQISGVEPRLDSKFIGMLAGEYLIVKTPTLSQLGGLEVKLFAGNQVIVRYIHAGSVFGFETSIIESISSPFRLLFLRAPNVIIDRNIRSNKRINTALPARLLHETEDLHGTVTDISITGCHFVARIGQEVPEALQQTGTLVTIALQVPGIEGELDVEGTLRNVQQSNRGHSVGIAFGDLDENAQLAIDGYLKLAD